MNLGRLIAAKVYIFLLVINLTRRKEITYQMKSEHIVLVIFFSQT